MVSVKFSLYRTKFKFNNPARQNCCVNFCFTRSSYKLFQSYFTRYKTFCMLFFLIRDLQAFKNDRSMSKFDSLSSFFLLLWKNLCARLLLIMLNKVLYKHTQYV